MPIKGPVESGKNPCGTWVVEKKQSGVGDKGWFGKRMVFLGRDVWYNRRR